MKISSPEFEQDGEMPVKYTCDGADQPPPLQISKIPRQAETIALIVEDPDAPGKTWVHWTVWNLPAEESLTLEGDLPSTAVEGVTSFGNTGYGGPCPPSGTHRYFFKAFALDVSLDLSSETSAKELEQAMNGHVVDKCGLVAKYSRE